MRTRARYAILEVLGAGACAQVVRARRLRDGPGAPEVALKVLRPELVGDAAVTRRFRDEGRILERLDHPNVVRVYELLDYDGRLVIEMELVEGGTLERVLAELGPLPAPVILAVIRQAAEALVAAWHAPGPDGRPMRIVHRDLKPANLGLSVDGRLRILDFGYAKGDFAGRAAQSLHDVWSTVGYDAPERREGQATQASDVYALGVNLYVGLTTRAMLLSLKEVHHDPDLESLLAHIPASGGVSAEALRALVADCMRFEADARVGLEGLIARIGALVPPQVADQALATFAAEQVRPLWERRMQIAPMLDKSFEDLRFLGERGPTPSLARLSGDEGRARLVYLLGLDRWEERVAELDPVIDACPDLPPGPLLEVVDRARVPGWRFWTRPSRPAEVEAALLVLKRIDRELARQRAAGLVEHPDERVRQVARYVIEE